MSCSGTEKLNLQHKDMKTMLTKTNAVLKSSHLFNMYNMLFSSLVPSCQLKVLPHSSISQFTVPTTYVISCVKHSNSLSKCQALLTTLNVALWCLRFACTVLINTSLSFHFSEKLTLPSFPHTKMLKEIISVEVY